MPVKAPPHPDCLHFAKMLRVACRKANLRSPARIGALVASAQEFPERESVPYHASVIKAWMNGTSVPDEPAFAALHDLLQDCVPVGFEDAYEAALFHAPKASEANVLFQHRLKDRHIPLKAFSQRLKEAGVTNPEGEALSGPRVYYWCSGRSPITGKTAELFDQLLPPQKTDVLFTRLEALGKPDPQEFLDKAAATTDIHRALRYLRRAIGMNYHQMEREINSRLPEGGHVSHVTIRNWELLDSKSTSHIPSNHSLAGMDPIRLYCDMLNDHGFTDWTTEHEAHLHGLMQARVQTHHHGSSKLFRFTEKIERGRVLDRENECVR